MSNFDRMCARLEYLGGDAEGRMRKDKLKSFEKSLLYSYQASEISKNDVLYKVLINPDKLKMDYDDKLVSASFEDGLKPGDVFHWTTTNTDWIVYTQQYSEDAYFRGSIRRCNYKLKWKDSFGVEQETFAAIRGPVETKIVSDSKSGISYDTPNYTLSILIPATEDTIKTFVRYYKVMLRGVAWEVQATDYFSVPGVLEMTLMEDYKNDQEDTDEVIGGKIVKNTTVISALDGATIPTNSPFDLWTRILLGAEELQVPYTYSLPTDITNASIVDNKLTLFDTNQVDISLVIPDIEYTHTYQIIGVDTPTNEVVLNIAGPLMVKPYGETTYSIKKYIDGIETTPTGSWTVTTGNYTISSQTATTLVLKWTSTKSGTIKITYTDGLDVTEQDIVIQSLF